MPIYKGTTEVQRVYKGDKECCVFKGDTLVHPNAVIYSTTETGNYTTPPVYFNGSQNRIYKTLRNTYNPKAYDCASNVEWKQYGDLFYFDIAVVGYYDIIWKATYRKLSGGSYNGLRVYRYIWDPANSRYTNEALLGESSSYLIQATPINIECVVRRTYLNANNAILVTSTLGDSTVLESNAVFMINKVN